MMNEPKKTLMQIEAEKNHHEAMLLKNQISKDWGFDRLVFTLVSLDLRRRMEKQMMLFSKAVGTSDYFNLNKQSLAYIRGLKTLEQFALDKGYKKLNPSIFSVTHPKYPDLRIFICENETMLPMACAMSCNEPNTVYYTAKELLVMIPDTIFEWKAKVSKSFKENTVTEVNPLPKPTTQQDIDGVAIHDELL